MLPSHFRVSFCVALILSAVTGSVAAAQIPQDSVRFVSVARTAHTRVLPSGIAVLSAKVANAGSASVEGTIIARVDGASTQESARRVVIRPATQLEVPIPVQLPGSIASSESVEVEFSMLVKDGDDQVQLTLNGAPVRHTAKLTVGAKPSLAGLAIEPEDPPEPAWYWPKQPAYSSYEFATASRIDSGNDRLTASYEGQPIPLDQEELRSIDVLIVAEESTLHDASTREALRRYLLGGGRIWAMADRFPIELLHDLLGDGQAIETVDSVELTDYVVDVREEVTKLAEVDRTVSLDDAVLMKRVVQQGGQVTHAIDGWPAGIVMPVGYGELVITTLDAFGWIEPRTEQVRNSSLYITKYQSRSWANLFASAVNVPRQQLPLSGRELAYPIEQIGNPVVPRSWVMVALTAFCVLVAAAGCLRFVGIDLTWIGLIAPVLALVVSGGLLAASSVIRSDIPENVSKLQVVEFNNDGTFAIVREQAAVHLASSRDMSLQGQGEGEARTPKSVATGVARYEKRDADGWQLVNNNWPSGTWRYETQYVLTSEPQIAWASLTATGVEIETPSELPSPLTDPVLAFVPGQLMLCQSDGGKLRSDGSLMAEGTRWISDSLITEEQQRRIDVYQAYFDLPEETRPLSQVLLGWTEVWPTGPKWDQPLLHQGSALTVLPVQLRRPDLGSKVLLPKGLVRVGIDRSADGQTLAYNESTGSWESELTMGVDARLQLQLPGAVLPFEAAQLDINLDIDAPQRDVTISAVTSSGPVEIGSLESPSIPWSTTITDPSVLGELRDGTLSLIVKVSERTDVADPRMTTNVVAWTINELSAQIQGSRGR
ncbi:MAG TPA: hypothetical protein DDW52_30470 [Planctomycetaceae bacterium]|nr:hypothetical protein [Planctomycetaceae bacterium]